jgi:hypothetical protein
MPASEVHVGDAFIKVVMSDAIDYRWSGALPVEVRDAKKLVVAARGTSDQVMVVPPGRYFVSATLPNGQQVVSDEIVDLKPDQTHECGLSISNLDLPAGLKTASQFSAAVQHLVRPVWDLFASHRASIIRGDWLKLRLGETDSTSLAREPVATSTLDVRGDTLPALLEIKSKESVSYFAIPVVPDGHTTVEWKVDPETGRPAATFDFNDGELNSFLDFVQNYRATEARSLSRSLLKQSEESLVATKPAALRAALAAYVLLRANELEALDRSTDLLLTNCPWLPDANAIRIEYLARVGEHYRASRQILDLSNYGAPWFRSGIAYVAERARLYVATRGSLLDLSDGQHSRLQRVCNVLGELCATLDLNQSICVFRDAHMPGQ